MTLRFLIIEGNTRPARQAIREAQGMTPAEHYGSVLEGLAGGTEIAIVCPADADATLPSGLALAELDGVAITGSALHVWEGAPEALRQVDLARAVFAAGVPFFGSCWGLQVAAVAAGGAVRRNPKGREIGFARDIQPTDAGRAHPMLAGRRPGFVAPCSRLDEVERLPQDSTLLASNAMSDVQAAEIRHAGGVFWGVQYHPEYGFAQIAAGLAGRVPALVAEGIFAQESDARACLADLASLAADPARRDLAWRYGLGPDMTNAEERRTELRNWITHRVRPRARQRRAA